MNPVPLTTERIAAARQSIRRSAQQIRQFAHPADWETIAHALADALAEVDWARHTRQARNKHRASRQLKASQTPPEGSRPEDS